MDSAANPSSPPPSPPLSASSASEHESTAPSTPAASDHDPMDQLATDLKGKAVLRDETDESTGATRTLKAGTTVGDVKSNLESVGSTTVPTLPAAVGKTVQEPTEAPPAEADPPTPTAPSIPIPPTYGAALSPIASPVSVPPTGPISPTPPPVFPRPAAAAQRPPPGPLAPGARRPPGQQLRAGVRGGPGSQGGMKIPPSLQAKLAGMASRSSSSSSLPPTTTSSLAPTPPPLPASSPSAPGLTFRPTGSSPAPPSTGMSKRRPGPGLTLAGMGASTEPVGAAAGAGRRRPPGMTLSQMGGEGNAEDRAAGPNRDTGGTPFSNFSRIVDPSGRLSFASKAIIHADGVDFSSGASFKIKMDDFELFEELGKGNYGTVQKVWHKPTKVTMALKEIRLELDDSKLKTIITELDILHRATSPYIIDFYGAFFIESCVYYCMEYMDAGSLEKVAGCDVPEDVLSRVTRCMVEGLKFLKDELKIMHRDVKPTNVLINKKGYIKLCDFGVSGQLDRSLAKTNIGCQSYMAPERIKGESMGAPTSYTASSDVWSLGLSIIEFAIGHYPYPPETYSNVFAQLTAIVHGDPPTLPGEDGEGEPGMGGRQRGYGEQARDFVGKCLEKNARERPTYAELLEHPFLKADVGREVDVVGWIDRALEYRERVPRPSAPALA